MELSGRLNLWLPPQFRLPLPLFVCSYVLAVFSPEREEHRNQADAEKCSGTRRNQGSIDFFIEPPCNKISILAMKEKIEVF